MAKSSKLVAVKRGRVLLVRRRRDGLWMFPGGRKLARESDKDCLRREIKEELPKLKFDVLGFGRKLKRSTVVLAGKWVTRSSSQRKRRDA
jgi:8-oxo-dGTP diphosphatase